MNSQGEVLSGVKLYCLLNRHLDSQKPHFHSTQITKVLGPRKIAANSKICSQNRSFGTAEILTRNLHRLRLLVHVFLIQSSYISCNLDEMQ